jgi:hypothetical protein
MRTNTKCLGLLAVFALLAFVPLAMAQKGGKNKPGGGGGGSGSFVRVNAEFLPSVTTTDREGRPTEVEAKILDDGNGPYQLRMDKDTGRFYIPLDAGRSVNFVFDSPLGNADDGCYESDNPLNRVEDLPALPPNGVLTAENLIFLTYRVVTAEGENWQTHDYLDFFDMPMNVPTYVHLHIQLNAVGVDGKFTVRHARTNDGGVRLGINYDVGVVEVTAVGSEADGIIDHWVMKPVQDTSLPIFTLNQANLSQYLAISGRGKTKLPARDCNHGDFNLPFELWVTLPQ